MEVGIYQQVLNGELDLESDPWPSISESAKDLLRGMLVRNTKKWMTAISNSIFSCNVDHPWIQADGVAPDKPLDTVVLSRLKQFSAMNRIKKIAIKVIYVTPQNQERRKRFGAEDVMYSITTMKSSKQATTSSIALII
uniref:Uncharacterized protein n=1 Tax=Lactuca sativa TaxID=4236 RepID=A0A9R1XBH6_LACSA|nr:hypothetical protein LSAT_V11C500259170 [Lactuca sativa]